MEAEAAIVDYDPAASVAVGGDDDVGADLDASPVLDSESNASGGGGGMRSDRGRRMWSFAARATSTAVLVAISS